MWDRGCKYDRLTWSYNFTVPCLLPLLFYNYTIEKQHNKTSMEFITSFKKRPHFSGYCFFTATATLGDSMTEANLWPCRICKMWTPRPRATQGHGVFFEVFLAPGEFLEIWFWYILIYFDTLTHCFRSGVVRKSETNTSQSILVFLHTFSD